MGINNESKEADNIEGNRAGIGQIHLLQARLSGPTKTKNIIKAITALLTFFIVCVLLYFVAFISHGATLSGVDVAQTSADNLNIDWTKSFNYLNDAFNNSSVSGIKKDLASSKADLRKSETQFNLILKSNALKDKSVNESFSAFSAKWNPYYNYLNSELFDLEGILPPLNQLSTTFNTTSSSTPAQANNILSSLKSAVNDANYELKSVQPTNAPDTKLVKDVTLALKNIAGSLTSAGQAQASGNQPSEIDDLISADNTFNSLSVTTNADTQNISKAISQLDPTNAYNNFGSSLDFLDSRLSK